MISLARRRAILLDLDGTLVDSAGDLADAVNAMLAGCSLAPLGDDDVRAMIGDGAAMLVRRAFEARQGAPPPDAMASFRAAYEQRCLVRTTPYPGMDALVRDLAAAGRQLAVVTNKPTEFATRILEGLDLARSMSAIIGPELARERKPSPWHVRAVLDALGARPEDAVMVGDGTTDIASGLAAGVATIGVLWGYRPVDELVAAGADATTATVDDLRALLLEAR